MKRLFQLLLVSSVLIVVPWSFSDDASKVEKVEFAASISKIRLLYTYLDLDKHGNTIKKEGEFGDGEKWGGYPTQAIQQVDLLATIERKGVKAVTTQDVWLVLSAKISPYVADIYEHPDGLIEADPNYAEMECLATWFDAIEVRRQSVELDNNSTIVTFKDVEIDQLIDKYMSKDAYRWVHAIKVKVILGPDDGDENYSDNMVERVIPVRIPY
jgi:hypothetical protein